MAEKKKSSKVRSDSSNTNYKGFKPDKETANEAKNAVRRFNYKVSKLSKNPEFSPFLPNKQTWTNMKRYITSPNDLAREVGMLNRFSRSKVFEPITMPNGVKTNSWTLQESMNLMEPSNDNKRKAKERLNAIEEKMQRDSGYSLYEPMNEMDFNGVYNMNKKLDSLRNNSAEKYYERRDTQYKKNYIDTLNEVFGKKAADIAWYIKRLPPDIVLLSVGSPYSINATYELNEENHAELLAYWQALYNDYKGASSTGDMRSFYHKYSFNYLGKRKI